MLLTVRLFCRPLLKKVVLVQLEEDVLHNLRLLLGRSSAKVVEANLEPLVNILVLDVELVTEFLGGLARLESLGLSGSAVLVCAADVQRRPVAKLAEARVDVGTEDTADDVSKMRDVVDIGKSAGDEDVLLALDGQDGIFNRH